MLTFFIYYLIWEAWSAAVDALWRSWWDETSYGQHYVFLCHGGLQEVREAKHPKAKLTDDEIDFYEWGNLVGKVDLSTNDLDSSTSILGLFISWSDVVANPSTGALSMSLMSWSNF
jgi:hypothetical protein